MYSYLKTIQVINHRKHVRYTNVTKGYDEVPSFLWAFQTLLE